MVSEPEAAATARHGLGHELAAYRRAAGYTQAEFAKLTGYSRSTIANVETGRQRVPRSFWERADAALRTGGTLAAAHNDLDAAARRDLRAAARSVSKSRQARTWHYPDNIPSPTQDGTADGAPPSHWAHVPWWPSDQAEAETGENAPLPSLGRSGPRPVTPGDVARLRSIRAHLKAIDNAHGGGIALPMATWYLRHEVLPLLNGHAHDPAARTLIEVVAEVEHDAGWMAYDAGQQQLATRYLTSSLRLAKAAGDRLLGGRILAAMSHQAIYLGHLRQGIDFAQAARSLTRQVATPRVTAMEAAMEACAHAASDDARQCHRALDDAAAAVALLTSVQPDPDWLDFDEGGYWGHAARAYRDLGELRKAEECAEKSIGLCLPEHSRTRAQRNTIQATAHLRMGEVDAAAAAGEQVVREAWNLHSGHVFEEIAGLAAAIKLYRTPAASDFLDEALELLAGRAPALDNIAQS